MNNTPINTLPQELLERLLSRGYLSTEDLAQVVQSSTGNEEVFLQDLVGSGDELFIEEIVYTNERSGLRVAPFNNEQHARQLFDMCPKVRIITMREVHWPSCRTSPAAISMFYSANHEHRQPITRIMVPNFGVDQSIWMVEGDDLVFNDQFQAYLQEFENLKSIEVAPPRLLE